MASILTHRLLPLILILAYAGRVVGFRGCPVIHKYKNDCTGPGRNECPPSGCPTGQKCCPTHDTCGVRCQRTKISSCPAKIDVALLLDRSGSISTDNWKKVVDFTKDAVDLFGVSEEGTHMAIVDYSDDAEVVFDFQKYTGVQRNSVNLKREIERMPPPKFGLTFIDKALKVANEEVFLESRGMRPDVNKICIVVTDGEQTRDQGSFQDPPLISRQLKDKGVEVYSFAIGERVDVNALVEMASGRDHLFQAKNFDYLSRELKRIVRKNCVLQEVSKNYFFDCIMIQ